MNKRQQRLEKILKRGRAVIIPMDDGLLDGPVGGLADMREKVREITDAKPDGVLGFLGIKLQCGELFSEETGFILNVTASTKYSKNPQRKIQLYTVEQALRAGACAVAVHVNVGSVHLDEQLEIIGRVAGDCYMQDMPLLAIIYPRGEMVREDSVLEATVYAARLAAEVGADMVKTKFIGGYDGFKEVVSKTPIPVIMAGGPKVSNEKILTNIYDCIRAGGAGVAIGRNAFHNEYTRAFVSAAKDIVHNEKTVEEVMRKHNFE